MEKIAFRLGPNDEHPAARWEYLWARELGDGTFQIDNVPLLARGISAGDRVAVVRHELGLLFRDRLASGGHSTLRVLVPGSEATDAAIARLCSILQRLGCATELSHIPGLIAVDVPPTVALDPVRRFLEEGQQQELWYVDEACVAP
jgi:uncharacterized protein DUF4265